MKSQHKSSILCWQMCRFVRLPRLLIETKVCQVQVAMNHKAAVHMTCFQSLAENKKTKRQSRPVKTPRVATCWQQHCDKSHIFLRSAANSRSCLSTWKWSLHVTAFCFELATDGTEHLLHQIGLGKARLPHHAIPTAGRLHHVFHFGYEDVALPLRIFKPFPAHSGLLHATPSVN